MAMPDHSELEREWIAATRNVQSRELRNTYFWQLIKRYSRKRRKYHNLHHIKALFNYVKEYESRLENANLLRLAVWYHDAVYRPLKKDNEEQSAALAVKQLGNLGFEQATVYKVEQLILATKSHYLPEGLQDFDSRFFMDIDLSILGAHPEEYTAYLWQVRKEYVLVPRFLYKKGRIAALEHLLGLRHIYKTDIFQPIEKRARENLGREIAYWQ